MTMGPGGGSDPGNAGRSGSNRGGGTRGGGRSSGRDGGGYGGAVGDGIGAAHGAKGPDSHGVGAGTDGFQTQADTRGEKNTPYGANAESAFGGFQTQMEATPADDSRGYTQNSSQALTNAQSSSARSRAHSNRGILSRATSMIAPIAGSMVGGPAGLALGLSASALADGKAASDSLSATNDTFGTQHDAGYGRAAMESLGIGAAGKAGSKIGGTMGGRIGASLGGMPGALAGGLLGAAGMGSAAKNLTTAAISGERRGSGPAGSASPGDEGSSGGQGGLIQQEITASRQAAPSTPSPQSPRSSPPDSGIRPGRVSGYGSYAESIFS